MLEDRSITLNEARAEQSKALRRRLVPVKALSYGKRESGNLLIHGNNLDAMDALLPRFRSKVRCIYIDPPYNNQENFAHYRDDLDHDTWLASLKARLERLTEFLTEDGSLWISIDDREVHYLKVAADKVLGRANFIATIVWQQRTTRENRKVFSSNNEFILAYAKNARAFAERRNPLPLPPEVKARYKNPDNDPRGLWQSVSLNVQAGHATPSQFYTLRSPNGKRHDPPNGRCWVYTKAKMQQEIDKGNVWFGVGGDGVPRLKRFLSTARCGVTPHTLWLAGEVGTSDSAKKQLLTMFPGATVFDTPKPEGLIQRILHLGSNPGDIVLDAYLGSGTTAAVAHQMNRRYIGIEEGKQVVTLCVPRLKRIVKGTATIEGWAGGGGFDFYRAR